jgi:hypothetical protein
MYMDAKTFINSKHDSAVEELKAIEAEYIPRRDAAQAKITLIKKWADELSLEKSAPEPEVTVSNFTKAPSNNWVSARDLNAQARLNS